MLLQVGVLTPQPVRIGELAASPWWQLLSMDNPTVWVCENFGWLCWHRSQMRIAEWAMSSWQQLYGHWPTHLSCPALTGSCLMLNLTTGQAMSNSLYVELHVLIVDVPKYEGRSAFSRSTCSQLEPWSTVASMLYAQLAFRWPWLDSHPHPNLAVFSVHLS